MFRYIVVLAIFFCLFNSCLCGGQVDSKLLESYPSGRANTNYRDGGHVFHGETTAATTWYLAEGYTGSYQGGEYETWISIMNPSSTNTATVTATFMTGDASSSTMITVEPKRRGTISVDSFVPAASVATKIESNVPVIAERPMYWSAGGVDKAGGSCSVGVTAAAKTWYLAEGYTGGTYETWVSVMNPSFTDTANVTATFMKSDSTTVQTTLIVDAGRRGTISIDAYIPSDSVSTQITSNVPVIAERPIYWSARGIEKAGGHVSVGVTAPANTWYLAEGTVGGEHNFDTWITVQNPNSNEANITLTFMKTDSGSVTYSTTVSGTQRITILANDYVSNDSSFSTLIESTNGVGIIVERPMYWDAVDSNTGQELQALLDRSIVDTGTTGAALFIFTPSIQWIGSSGYANSEARTAMNTTDMLRLASMTKTFVSVIVQKLCEEGKMDLDDKIQQYLSSAIVGRIPYGPEITVRQLLNMTSGIYNYTESDLFNDAIDENPYRSPWTAEQVLEYVYSEEASFAPGADWEYSNTNYVLLDMIVKAVSNTSLASEMRRIIHNPLGLKNTFMEIQEPRDGGFGGLIVQGYETDGENVTEIQDGLGMGDGGLISNVEDIAKFLQGLFVDKSLLDSASLDQMVSFHVTEDYGLGLERVRTKYGEAWGHSGGSSGFEGDMLYIPSRGTFFILLSNTVETEICETVFERVMELLFHSN